MVDGLNASDWPGAWAAIRNELMAGLSAPAGSRGAEALRRIVGFGDDYLALAQSLLAQTSGAELHAALRDRYERLFTAARMPQAPPTLPLFDPAGAQGMHERLIAATVRCQRAGERFKQLLAAIAMDAGARLAAALQKPDDAEPPVTSLRQLHELWVRCGEEAYAVAAHGEDFAGAQAELLAATVEWRHEQRELADRWARALGLPTAAEVDAINERVHALLGRITELERELGRQGATQP